MHYKEIMSPYVTPLTPLPTAIQSFVSLTAPIRGILFDIYGTLFISASGDISLVRENTINDHLLETLLKKYKIQQGVAALKKKFINAISSAHSLKKTSGIDFPEIRVDQIWMKVLHTSDNEIARRFAIEYEMIVNPVYPMPGLADVLRTFKQQNLVMGIISNAQFFTPHLFDLFLNAFPQYLGFNPDLCFYSYEDDHAKPSPVLFDKASKKIAQNGYSPDEFLFVGNDMLNDILPAHNAGFQTCLFAGDTRSLRLRKDRAECRELAPHAVIKELNQLTNMIQSF